MVLFSLRYHTAFHGARAPTPSWCRRPQGETAAILPSSGSGASYVRLGRCATERALIGALHHNENVPGVTVGVGSQIPDVTDAPGAAVKFGLERPYVLYVGRIDVNKGCAELFEYFLQYVNRSDRALDLVLIGAPVLPVPVHHASATSATSATRTNATCSQAPRRW